MNNIQRFYTKRIIQYINIFFTVLLAANSFAQDISFSQYYAVPVIINPAMAGNEKCPRLTALYRNQWPGVAAAYNTYGLFYDQYADILHGGVALYAIRDEQADGTFTKTSFYGAYSYYTQISKKIHVRAALHAGYNYSDINVSGLIYPDMVTNGGTVSNEITSTVHAPNHNYDLGAGFVGFTKKFYLGLSIHHIQSRKNTDFDEKFYKLAPKYTMLSGMNIKIGDKYTMYPVYIYPNIIVEKQGDFEQINWGAYLNWRYIWCGCWLKQNFGTDFNTFVVLFGADLKRYRIAYSYDYNLFQTFNQFGNAHELSFIYKFKCLKKKKVYKAISCPKF